MDVALKGLHTVNSKGRVYYYAWRGGPRLRSEPHTPAFIAEFEEAHKARYVAIDNTIHSLITQFLSTPDFKNLSRLTRRDHLSMFDKIRTEFGQMPIAALEDRRVRGVFMKWRDSIKSDRQADRAWSSLRRLMSFALDRGEISWNPCTGGGKRYTATRADKTWDASQIDQIERTASFEVLLPFTIALHTGQRQGDILRLQWSNYDGQRIRLTQRKTGRKVSVLVTHELKRILDQLPKDSTYICLSSKRMPWTSHGYSASFRKAQAKAHVSGVTFHDLRGTFITQRRNEGSSLEDIADVVGLSTKDVSKVLERHYLAHDETRADAVILRMKG